MLLEIEKKLKEKGNLEVVYVLQTLLHLLLFKQLLLCKFGVETLKTCLS